MHRIKQHPILNPEFSDKVTFRYQGKDITGEKGFTIAAALHQAGFPVHSHSRRNRNRGLECGIGKCGACEMLVDGRIKRICITRLDGVRQVKEIPRDYRPAATVYKKDTAPEIFKTDVAIIGAGPAGLAAREVLQKHNVPNIVIDNNDKVGGQFVMQTHQFFFFEKAAKFGAMRGFEIAEILAGDNHDGIFLNSTVWDILQGRMLAVKNLRTDRVYYVEAEHLIVATGAIPFMPPFENDDVPGVYTAAVIQKMMNIEFTLLGHNVLTVGAGNIGYLTSYQLIQAGAHVKAIIEARDTQGGFCVQANRIKRLGVPFILSHMLLKAIPNKNKDGIVGAIIAQCKDFQPIPGTEQCIYDIDAINICTGLVPDDQLLTKGYEIFARNCHGAGDAVRIGEGTSAVLRGAQAAYEILDDTNISYDYEEYLSVSKEYIDSQQSPFKILDKPIEPEAGRKNKPFVMIDCPDSLACNPCEFACRYNAIKKSSTTSVPRVDFEKCVGCMECIHQCPGQAIIGYDLTHNRVFMAAEYNVQSNAEVFLVDNNGRKLGDGIVQKIQHKENKTNVVTVKSANLSGDELLGARGFIPKSEYPARIEFADHDRIIEAEKYICHCDDVTLDEVLDVIGDRKFISVDEIKHTTRLGMGACRGKRCIVRLKQTLAGIGISLVGQATPRAPLDNQLTLGEIYPSKAKDIFITGIGRQRHEIIETDYCIAGGGIGGSALFRYLAEQGLKPVMINYGRGASWRNIAGGRTSFSLPELSDIAAHNHEIFKQLQKRKNIDYRPGCYVTFAHNEQIYRELEKSMAFSDSYMVEPADFQKEISPYINPNLKTYIAALVTKNCWQAAPGKVIDLIRTIGIDSGGVVLEDCRLIDVEKDNGTYKVLIQDHNKKYITYHVRHFINALGPDADKFAKRLGMDIGLYPVRHHAFITRKLPMMGLSGEPLPMMIDRRKYKGFTAVYGQQLCQTGQIIGCASPAGEHMETDKNLKINSKQFLETVSEIFVDWIDCLSSVGFQAVWAGYYVEPKMTIDPAKGLFVGLRGQGYMLAQYLAKMYVDKLLGKDVPQYFDRLKLDGDGLLEKTFK